jgi:hypothetical protein
MNKGLLAILFVITNCLSTSAFVCQIGDWKFDRSEGNEICLINERKNNEFYVTLSE